MNDNFENNDVVISAELRRILDASKSGHHFLVPENYFDQLSTELSVRIHASNVVDDLMVPDGYFEDAENAILAMVDSTKPNLQDFFAEQENVILSRIRLETLKAQDDLKTEDGFFQTQEQQILSKIQQETRGKIVFGDFRVWSYVAAAAVVLIGVFVLIPTSPKVQHDSFSALLSNTDLDVNDLDYFASEEDIYDLYLNEVLVMDDTLVVDSLVIDSFVTQPRPMDKDEYVRSSDGKMKLDPKTGLPLKKMKDGIKPSGENGTPNWDDITDEDLMKYLMEEGDEDLLND